MIIIAITVSSCAVNEKSTSASEQTVQTSNTDTISKDLREQAFELAREYRFDAIPIFTEGSAVPFSAFKWYVYSLKQRPITGADVEQTASDLFEITFGLEANEQISLEASSAPSPVFADLVEYKKENADDGRYRITLTYRDLGKARELFGFLYSTAQQQEEREYQYSSEHEDSPIVEYVLEVMEEKDMSLFQAIKEIIVSGNGEKLSDKTDELCTLIYLSSDGITPEKILSKSEFVN